MRLIILLLFTLGSLAQAQTTRYVTTTGTNVDPATATSWATSTTDLQGAIAASSANDAVWVAAGSYQPGGPANTDRTLSFTMKNGVAIYGGFVGNETLLSERPAIDPIGDQPSSTTLSGDIGTVGNAGDNSHHVIYNSNLNNTAILDGVVITAGTANGIYTAGAGGGMYNYQYSSPVLTNVSFQGNTARYNGGGMFNSASRSPRLTNVSFQGNTASNNGGGMYNYYDGSPVLTNVSFQGNTASNIGGGMFNYWYSIPVLTNVSFQGNTASQGGGMCNSVSSRPSLTNVSFQGNTAGLGGGMDNRNNSSAVLTNCVLFGNGGSNTFYNQTSYPSVSATYSLFETGAETAAGVDVSGPGNLTNVTSSPFVSPTSVALLPCSPAVNAGSNAANPTAIDLVGNPRLFGGTIDMGAVELQSLPYVAITQPPASGSAICAGGTVTASVSVSGSVSSYAWYKDGQELNPAQPTASLSLTNVQSSQTGSYQLIITGACNSLTSTAFSLTVNSPPSVASAGVSQTITTGTTATLTANLPTMGTGSWSVVSGPSTDQAQFSSTTNPAAVFTPGGGVGSYDLVWIITNAPCTPSSSPLTITVIRANTAPVAPGNTNQTATVGQAFSYTVNAFTDADAQPLTYTASISPANDLSFNPATHVISGTPTTTGVSSVTITATDPGNLSASTTFTITVSPAPVVVTPLSLSLTASPMMLLTSGSTTLSANLLGGTSPYSYVFAGPGTISPSGNTASVSGLMAGVQTFTVTATDATSPAQTISATVSVTVSTPAPVNQPPVATPNTNQTAAMGTAFSYTVNAFTDAESPNSLTYSASISPPNDFGFDPATRVISGTPTTTGVSSVTVRATDPGNLSANTTFTITVSPAPVVNQPTITNFAASPNPVCGGSPLTFTATVNSVNGPYAFTLTNGSNGVTGTASSTAFSGILTAGGSGSQSFSLIVANGGPVALATTTVLVNPPPTVSLLVNGSVLQASAGGGVLFERVIVIDRINGYEIRQSDSNTTSFFTITRMGPYRVTVTGGNGCRSTVESRIDTLP